MREGREAAGLTQTQLAERIGASRFWVAAFEQGKPSVELGLALKAIQALGLAIRPAVAVGLAQVDEGQGVPGPQAFARIRSSVRQAESGR